MSIAWAVSEHLHERVGCKTVFATHYHELTQLADDFVSICNYNVSVTEVGEKILFLHKLMPGGADRSYGIEVGRLAGLPQPVITRARALLHLLEGEQLAVSLGKHGKHGKSAPAVPAKAQLALFAPEVPPHAVVRRLRTIDANTMTPLEALALLAQLAAEAKQDSDS